MKIYVKQIVLVAALLILIITNPSMRDFKENQAEYNTLHCYRKYNFYIFSVYHSYQDYIGVFGNFVAIRKSNHATVINQEKRGAVDTTNIIETDEFGIPLKNGSLKKNNVLKDFIICYLLL
ncbi:hypothetical protein [Mucilaginibacter gilvus]|uniref:Uncharacterized protein n=1 Tax=Mucilaginibacter gilvus TaxID=2305909 RepID=A0A3S3UMP7_9SPHI|nr:hypothetical protein [Mucilaginibacter gilvus]RWY50022.1 hypothetical protein EPL05_14765 [Mucilaginibacter gilvus]